MKAGNLLVGGAILGAIFFFLKSAKKLTKLDISLAGLKLNSTKTNLSETVFNADLSIYNPNTQAVVFKSFIGNLYTEDKTRIGNIDTQVPDGTNIPARTTTKVPVNFVVSNTNTLQTILPNVIKWLSGSGSTKAILPSVFIVSGSLKAENLPALPITQKFKLS